MAKFVRVFIPINSPEGTLKLGTKIIARNTVLGVDSPLVGFVDMADFNTNKGNAASLQESGDINTRDAQALYNKAAALCGLAKGQNRRTKGTVLYTVIQVRDVLLLKYRGTEEEMETFGFNVVISTTGARKYVRVTIPENKPEDLLELADDIITRDTVLGAASPLVGNVDMVAFAALVTSANAMLGQWETADENAQADHNEALTLLGYAIGQTSETVGTIYYDMVAIRDRLLSVYEGTEEELSRWGFDVVISEHELGGKKTKPTKKEGPVNPDSSGDIDLSKVTVTLETHFQLENPGTTELQFYFSDTPGGSHGDLFVPVAPGQSVVRSAAELGLGISRVYFTVRNLGSVVGEYRVVVEV